MKKRKHRRTPQTLPARLRLSRYGIKSNSGLGVAGFFHVSAPYDCNGKVFVETPDGERWERVTARQAMRRKLKVIACCMCDKPAVSLDHLWPYYVERNRCKKHYNE